MSKSQTKVSDCVLSQKEGPSFLKIQAARGAGKRLVYNNTPCKDTVGIHFERSYVAIQFCSARQGLVFSVARTKARGKMA